MAGADGAVGVRAILFGYLGRTAWAAGVGSAGGECAEGVVRGRGIGMAQQVSAADVGAIAIAVESGTGGAGAHRKGRTTPCGSIREARSFN